MGAGIGLAGHNGELCDFIQPKFQNYYLNPALVYNLNYRLADRFSIRGEIMGFTIYSESESDTTRCSYEEFSFRSYNIEYHLSLIIDLFPKGKIDGLIHRWDAHFFAGLGHILFIPRDAANSSTLTGTQVDPSSCEKIEGIQFSKLGAVFPVGLGIKRYLNKDSYISFEVGYRGDEIGELIGGMFKPTDFLDGVKETGSKADKYVILNFKINWLIGMGKEKSFNYNKYRYYKHKKAQGK